MNFFKNSYFIGIVTGVLSGLLVFFVTNFFVDNRKKREYEAHIKEANSSIINALKPYIAEQGLPEYEILNSLIASTSRNYHVNSNDLFSTTQICEELIREIIADVYVSSDKKKEYTNNVAKFKSEILNKKTSVNEVLKESIGPRKTEERLRLYLLILSITMLFFIVISATIGVMYIVDPRIAKEILYFPFKEKDMALVTTLSTILTAMTTFIVAANRLRKARDKKESLYDGDMGLNYKNHKRRKKQKKESDSNKTEGLLNSEMDISESNKKE